MIYKYTTTNQPRIPEKEGNLKADDQYKRGTTAGIVLLCSLLLLASDGMTLIYEIFTIMGDPPEVVWKDYLAQEWHNYLIILLNLWAIPNNILALICGIGDYMTLWGNLRVYMWIVFGAFVAYDIYGSIEMVFYLLRITDQGEKEEMIFAFIFNILNYLLFALRQICFLRMYDIPATRYYYVVPYYDHKQAYAINQI